MTWWGVVLIAWGAFLVGFLLAAMLATGKEADQAAEARIQELEEKLGDKS